MDQLGAMRTFVRVVQTGSFSAAAREQNTTQATVSKKVAALENELGAKLLTRSSRDLSMTEVGATYYESCVSIIAELDEAEAQVRSQQASPKGGLRVAAPVVFGCQFIAPILGDFLKSYPEISVDLMLSDKHVDLVADGIDVAIRAKQLEDSSLVARHLFDNPLIVVASPDYLTQFGHPISPASLKQHNCLVYSMLKSVNIWHFTLSDMDSEKLSIPVSGNCRCDNGEAILQLALSGVGIAQLPTWMVDEHIESGRLSRVLSDYIASPLPFNAVYPQNRYVPLKVRCFVDYMKQRLTESRQYQ
ncbi:LysR family transcriptional regulator [Shewanella fidelis]|uniref:LysR family transcriptional regulator n=1 Tax=Shewanella fidelis TaxID=173509 RepID=A0AAW8NQG3_9GAMM|nr:LysR family transcriptional regulator [Shewanella fidelis]MDR8524922.1 LysR family transcriptional regulator [Shewanella fidelis]MDW4810993.1 LysR family transcriptional regulator [Shewanella fidelis]MDW4815228.1 LysR family transcriptional regulator [Shewanella fidelis]MDW4819318.1 LysR family transcriptional regulator [Shewanella fidelis]MDW4823004.1 LysR family transcriptional regulator [Shewanella fidelis]